MGVETRGGAHGIMPVGFLKPEHQPYVGKRLDEIAAMRGQDWIEATLDLLVAEGQRISTIYFSMDEANLRLQVQQPWIKFSTDAGGFDPAWAKAHGPVHPRGYGTYPRVLRKYVREERLLTLEDAVRKMTSSVADRLSLRDRGQLRGLLRRRRRVRPGDDRRPRHLRRPAPALGGGPRRLGQRRPRAARRRPTPARRPAAS
jgi:N-acyl-D-aspartate/D-glutamate deacylase